MADEKKDQTTPTPSVPPKKVPEVKEPEVKKEPDVKMKDVSDQELFSCLCNEHEVGSVSKGMGGSSVGSLTAGNRSYGAITVPWMTIATLLAKVGLPMAKPSLEKLRDRIQSSAWPNWVKAPILAALDSLLNDPTLFETFMRSVQINGTINK